jgi:hypothetical protein
VRRILSNGGLTSECEMYGVLRKSETRCRDCSGCLELREDYLKYFEDIATYCVRKEKRNVSSEYHLHTYLY